MNFEIPWILHESFPITFLLSLKAVLNNSASISVLFRFPKYENIEKETNFPLLKGNTYLELSAQITKRLVVFSWPCFIAKTSVSKLIPFGTTFLEKQLKEIT
jgi:hypothetical protein